MYKLFMSIFVRLYRLTKGKMGGHVRDFNVLLLTSTGRKTGKQRTVALGAFAHPEGWVVVASNAGQPNHPAWYYNLKSQPQVTVQVLDKIFAAKAEILSGEARAQAWQQVIRTAPTYAAYEKRTSREIPLILLRPKG